MTDMLFETAATELMWCGDCRVYSRVTEVFETAGFCTGFVYVTDLACGCSVTDDSSDTLED